MTIEEVISFEEMQIFDRKSINIDAKSLAVHLVAFANADGGTIAIGISDKTRKVEGTDYEVQKLNELLRVPFDYCEPTIRVEIENVSCIDYQGRANHVVLMHVEPGLAVHANQADEVFMRVGDKSKKLTFMERTQLMYDKGERYFEDKLVPDADLEDIDMEFVKTYIDRIGYQKTALEYLKENKGFVKEKDGKMQVSIAAMLLFGKNPQNYFPRARVRFIRYEGTEEKFGSEMNVIKDVIFEGNILKMVTDAIAYLDTQIKEKTYLGKEGLFVTEEEYPKFVRQEIIVNAVTHRAYSITGTDIQIKMFDNRLVVESPGKLPGLVRADNIRYTHFSRNPKIAEFLKAYDFVKEYGEGVDRMCRELEVVGLKKPEYYTNAFMLQTVIFNAIDKQLDISMKNECLENKKATIELKNECLEGKKATIEQKGELFDIINKLENEKKISKVIARNCREIVKTFDVYQIFGRKEIKKELGYGESKAGRMLDILEKFQMIEVVLGKGKGKYIIKIDNGEKKI